MSVLVTPTEQVPMSAVAAAALAECGRDAIRLDTGGTRHGIRVPDDASAEAVRAQAEVLARSGDATTLHGMTVTPAEEDMGRPACGGAAAPVTGGGETPTPPAQRRRPRRKKIEE